MISHFPLLVLLYAAPTAEPEPVDTTEAPSPAKPAPVDPVALEHYKRRLLGLAHFGEIEWRTYGAGNTRVRVGRKGRKIPYRGAQRHPIEFEEFYIALGHQEAVDKMKRRRGIRWGLFGGGLATMIGGMTVVFTGMSKGWKDSITLGVGIPVAVVGAGVTTAGNFVDPYFVDDATAARWTDQYNAQLRTELGLHDAAAVEAALGEQDPSRAGPKKITWRPLIAPGVNGGSVGVHGRF